MQQIVTNNYVDMALTGLLMALIVPMVLFSLQALVKAWQTQPPDRARRAVSGAGQRDRLRRTR